MVLVVLDIPPWGIAGMLVNCLLSIVNCLPTFEGPLKATEMKSSEKEKQLVEVLEVVETTDINDLVVFNDDFNTFEHVIATLIRVCRHTPEQAEQCTWLIHHKGKCTVKTGAMDELKPMKEAICEVGIDAKIL